MEPRTFSVPNRETKRFYHAREEDIVFRVPRNEREEYRGVLTWHLPDLAWQADVRVWSIATERPTKRGLSVPLEHLPALAAGSRQLEAEAERRRLIDTRCRPAPGDFATSGELLLAVAGYVSPSAASARATSPCSCQPSGSGNERRSSLSR
jgi:hypothetical protein